METQSEVVNLPVGNDIKKQGKKTIWSNVCRIIKNEFSSEVRISKNEYGQVLKKEEVVEEIKLKYFPSDNTMEDNEYHHEIKTRVRDQRTSQKRQREPKINVKEKEHAFKYDE